MRKTLLTAVAATATLAAVAATVPAQATGAHHHARGIALPYKIVASNLNNPRGIAFGPKGDMYVAEAGKGGNGACLPDPEGGPVPVCFGFSGSVTRVAHGKQHRVLKNLPSIGGQGTGDASIGPSGVVATGKHSLVLSMGLGTDPRNRKKFPQRAQKELATLLSFDLRSGKHTVVGDLGKHERRANPVDNPDSDPTGVAKAGKAGFVVTDSGGNTLVSAKGGKVKSVAPFQDRMGVSPITGPAPVPYQSVPTDVVKGPDGALYVSELTGFPFIQGASRIWRVVPGHKPKVCAKGLTNVTNLAWSGKKLYAVQLTDAGLTSGPPDRWCRSVPGSPPRRSHPVSRSRTAWRSTAGRRTSRSAAPPRAVRSSRCRSS